jgi:hypothetical protein
MSQILSTLMQLPILLALLLACGAALKPALDRRLDPRNRRNGWLLFAAFLLIFLVESGLLLLSVMANQLIRGLDILPETYLYIHSAGQMVLLVFFIMAGVVLLLFRSPQTMDEGGL